jgi:pyridoxal phosphate enzyme (YggS family)
VRSRIDDACRAAGRDPSDVTLIAVSKTWPAADVLRLVALGQRDFGESYDQEARAKVAAVRSAGVEPRWHFVGRVQRNKARSIASYADVVHSLDRPEVVDALGAGARHAERVVGALVQVAYDADQVGAGSRERSGVAADAAGALADRIAATEGLRLLGAMTVAPLGADPEPLFRDLVARVRELAVRHPSATLVSAGMSGDLEAAVASGATHLRVGTAILGRRPTLG